MIGRILGPYQVVAKLGEGGMGEVYRARDTRLERDVAIKVLGATFAADADRVRRFTIEAQATGALNHPNILAVYDIGTHEGAPYLVTELLDGETLRSRMDADRVPLSKALELARQVASGLAAAHAKGITHRDIKPENLFVTTDGRAKILDFGLAKQLGAAEATPYLEQPTVLATPTEAGMVLGTVGYMSPEQVRGETADARSDIFSFGVVLYELLSGQRPFVGDSAVQTMNAILTEDPPEIVPTGRPLPPALERVVRHCLEKKRDERFQSARDLAFALEALSSASGASSSGVAAVAAVGTPASERRRRVPVVVALSALAAGVLVTLAAMAWTSGPPGVNLAAYRYTRLAVAAEAESDPAWSPDGTMLAHSKAVDGREHIFVHDIALDTSIQLTHGALGGTRAFWWPDGQRIGFIGTNGTGIYTVSRIGGTPELIQPGRFEAVTLSPDGTTLVAWRLVRTDGTLISTVVVATPPTGEWREYTSLPRLPNYVPVYLRFAPDGRLVLLSAPEPSGKPAIWLLPIPDDGRPAAEIPLDALTSTEAPTIAWMPDGRHFVLGERLGGGTISQLWMQDLKGGPPFPISIGLTDQEQPDVSVDGRLAFTAGQGDYDLVELPIDGSPMRTVLATGANEYSASWMPNDEGMVYVTNRAGASEIRVRTGRGGERSLAKAPAGGVLLSPEPSPRGDRIVFAQFPDPSMWVVPAIGGVPTRVTLDGVEFGSSWSPGGDRLVTIRDEGSSYVPRFSRIGSTEAPVDRRRAGLWPAVPEWSPGGAWVAAELQGRGGIVLLSPDSAAERIIGRDRGYLTFGWGADDHTLYALSRSGDDTELLAIDTRTDATRVIRSFGPEVRFGTPDNPGLRLSYSPTRKTLLTTTVRTNTDIWILDNFWRPAAGWRRWFGLR